MIRAIRSIVHGNQNVDQAFKFYTDLCAEKNKSKSAQNKPQAPKENKPQKSKPKPSKKASEPKKTPETTK